jgi:post-segregation antitoxin (ccd killing protein)
MSQSNQNPDAHRPGLETRDMENEAEETRRFKRENAEAFASLNAWVEENGLPLARHRQF